MALAMAPERRRHLRPWERTPWDARARERAGSLEELAAIPHPSNDHHSNNSETQVDWDATLREIDGLMLYTHTVGSLKPLSPEERNMWKNHWESIAEFYAAQNTAGSKTLESHIYSVFNKLGAPVKYVANALGYAGRKIGNAVSEAYSAIPAPARVGALTPLAVFLAACGFFGSQATPTSIPANTPTSSPTAAATATPTSENTAMPEATATPVQQTCEINGFGIKYNSVDDKVGDANTPLVDIAQASIMQVSPGYLQLNMTLGTGNVPFIPNKQNYLWLLDTDPSRPGPEYIIRLNAVSGSGVKDTWHVWVESMREGGMGIYHFPAAKFDKTFSALIPLKLLNSPDTISWKARAEYLDESDETPSAEHRLNYNSAYPSLSITSDAETILSGGAVFNNLGKGGLISFSVGGVDGKGVEYFSSYSPRLAQVSGNQFQGNGNGISMVFARVDGCYLVPQPLVIANGSYLLEGKNTAFVFNTQKKYDEETMRTLDALSGIQRDLIGFYPHNGQLLIVEESDSNVLASPNTEFPIPVPLFVPQNPDWFYFLHEYGHHFHGGNTKMMQLFKDFYNEPIPSLIAYAAMEEAVSNPQKYGIPLSKLETILNDLNRVRNTFLTHLSKYETQGSQFENLSVWPPQDFDPNSVYNGIMLKIQDQEGKDVVRRFFDLFNSPTGLDFSALDKIQPTTQNQKHTAFVAAWSVAANKDLRPLFKQWNYPIDDAYFNRVLPELSKW